MSVRMYSISITFVAQLTAFLIEPAMADDFDICTNGSGEAAIAGCTSAIESGKYSDRDLAKIYSSRARQYHLRALHYDLDEDYDRVIEDVIQAIRLNQKADKDSDE